MCLVTVKIEDITVNQEIAEDTLTSYAYHQLSKLLPTEEGLDPWEYGHSYAVRGLWEDGEQWEAGTTSEYYCEVGATVVFISERSGKTVAVVTVTCDVGD